MHFIASFIALSIGGIINSGYLVYKHQNGVKKPLVCPMDHDCSVVTESKWSKIFGVRNEILGFLFFIFVFLAMLSTFVFTEFTATIYLLLFIFTGGAVLFSGFLVLVQIYAIKDYCFYCIISAILTLLVFINTTFLFIQLQ